MNFPGNHHHRSTGFFFFLQAGEAEELEHSRTVVFLHVSLCGCAECLNANLLNSLNPQVPKTDVGVSQEGGGRRGESIWNQVPLKRLVHTVGS